MGGARGQVRLFVYGTLREAGVFARAAGTAAPLAAALPATLPGWRRVRLAGTPYPTLLADPRAETDGLLVAVSQAQLARLHRYEGPAYRFRRVRVTVGSLRIAAHAWISPHADPETPWP